MICRKCKKEAPDGAFCIFCGTKQEKARGGPKKRGNGQGSVFKLKNGKYRAEQVLGYYPDENGGCSYTKNCEVSYKGNCIKCKEDFILIGKTNQYSFDGKN